MRSRQMPSTPKDACQPVQHDTHNMTDDPNQTNAHGRKREHKNVLI